MYFGILVSVTIKHRKKQFRITSLTMSSFKQKYIIRKQRQTIRNILDHIKHPTRKVTNSDLKEYLYHLGTIIDITSDIKIARAAKKVVDIVRRYLKYRVHIQTSRFTIR